jgi:hypothetical protein
LFLPRQSGSAFTNVRAGQTVHLVDPEPVGREDRCFNQPHEVGPDGSPYIPGRAVRKPTLQRAPHGCPIAMSSAASSRTASKQPPRPLEATAQMSPHTVCLDYRCGGLEIVDAEQALHVKGAGGAGDPPPRRRSPMRHTRSRRRRRPASLLPRPGHRCRSSRRRTAPGRWGQQVTPQAERQVPVLIVRRSPRRQPSLAVRVFAELDQTHPEMDGDERVGEVEQRDVPIALRIGKGTLRKMRQNLGWAIGYNAVALPIAAGVF